MFKKIGVTILCITLILAFVGCSSPTQPTTSEVPETTEAVTNTEPTESAQKEPVVITLGMHVADTQAQEPATWAIIKAFEAANPNIKVEIIGAETDEHVKNMKMLSQTGELPDIFWMLPAPAKEMQQAGYLLDLTEFLAANPTVSDYLPQSMKDSANVDGFQYGLPYQPLVTGFWYNKALFKEYGIAEPVPGTTFDELLSMAEGFSSHNVATIAQGAKSPFSVWAWLTAYCRYGYFDRINNILSGSDKFNNPDFVKFYEKIAELSKAGAFPTNIATIDYFQAKDMFLQGQTAMFNSGHWDAQAISDALGENAGFWWGPTFSDGIGDQKVLMKVSAAPFVVSAKVADDAARKDAVYQFLAFYYGEEAAKITVENSGIPVINYLPDVDTSGNPAYTALLQALALEDWKSPYAQPDLIVSEAVQNAMYDSLYGVMVGTYTPSQALDVIDSALATD